MSYMFISPSIPGKADVYGISCTDSRVSESNKASNQVCLFTQITTSHSNRVISFCHAAHSFMTSDQSGGKIKQVLKATCSKKKKII